MVWSVENVGTIEPDGYTQLGLIPSSCSAYGVSLPLFSDVAPRKYGFLQVWSFESIDTLDRIGIYQDLTVTVWSAVTLASNIDNYAANQRAFFYAPGDGIIAVPTPFEFWCFLL